MLKFFLSNRGVDYGVYLVLALSVAVEINSPKKIRIGFNFISPDEPALKYI